MAPCAKPKKSGITCKEQDRRNSLLDVTNGLCLPHFVLLNFNSHSEMKLSGRAAQSCIHMSTTILQCSRVS